MRAWFKLQQQEAVGVFVQQYRHRVHQVVTFTSGDEALMHRFLHAGGVVAYRVQRGSQASMVGNVVDPARRPINSNSDARRDHPFAGTVMQSARTRGEIPSSSGL